MRNLFRSKHKITQAFGVNPDYYKKFGLVAHEGLDLIPTGSDWTVYALEDGVVVKDEDNKKSGAYGVYTTIWHPTIKKATQYCHLEFNLVDNGMQVKKGQAIGKMGATGNTQGAHVHLNLFSVDDNGVRLNRDNGYLGGVDPLPFLEESTESIDLQRELDQVRQERDKNWNLYTAEQKRAGDLEVELNKIKKERDESDKAIITLNTKIESLSQAMAQDAVSDKDILLHSKELEQERDSALSQLNEIGKRVGVEPYDYNRVLDTLESLKKPIEETISYYEPVIEVLLKNIVKGRKTKSLLDKIFHWLR